jgi:hypothetical protein
VRKIADNPFKKVSILSGVIATRKWVNMFAYFSIPVIYGALGKLIFLKQHKCFRHVDSSSTAVTVRDYDISLSGKI